LSSKLNIPERLSVSEDEIHVWLVDINKVSNSDSNHYYSLLSDDEKVRMGKYHFEKDRKSFRTTRAILRTLLSKYLIMDNENISFQSNKYGKPYLDSPKKNNFKFNVSHSREYTALAFNWINEIGIDIEYINKELKIEEIVNNYFSSYEIQQLFRLEQKKRRHAFFRIWTRKEAFIKAIGRGLSIPLDSFDVSVGEECPKILNQAGVKNLANYKMHKINVKPNYCSTLVSVGNHKSLVVRQIYPSNT